MGKFLTDMKVLPMTAKQQKSLESQICDYLERGSATAWDIATHVGSPTNRVFEVLSGVDFCLTDGKEYAFLGELEIETT